MHMYVYTLQIERDKLLRERLLREQAEQEKDELKEQLLHFQDKSRMAQDALVSLKIQNEKMTPALLFNFEKYCRGRLDIYVVARPEELEGEQEISMSTILTVQGWLC